MHLRQLETHFRLAAKRDISKLGKRGSKSSRFASRARFLFSFPFSPPFFPSFSGFYFGISDAFLVPRAPETMVLEEGGTDRGFSVPRTDFAGILSDISRYEERSSSYDLEGMYSLLFHRWGLFGICFRGYPFQWAQLARQRYVILVNTFVYRESNWALVGIIFTVKYV